MVSKLFSEVVGVIPTIPETQEMLIMFRVIDGLQASFHGFVYLFHVCSVSCRYRWFDIPILLQNCF